MDKMIMEGGLRLKGEAVVGGSKNATLPIMVAALLGTGPSVVRGTPQLRDITTMNKVLEVLGAKAYQEGSDLYIDPKGFKKWEAPYDLVSQMRASIYVMGP